MDGTRASSNSGSMSSNEGELPFPLNPPRDNPAYHKGAQLWMEQATSVPSKSSEVRRGRKPAFEQPPVKAEPKPQGKFPRIDELADPAQPTWTTMGNDIDPPRRQTRKRRLEQGEEPEEATRKSTRLTQGDAGQTAAEAFAQTAALAAASSQVLENRRGKRKSNMVDEGQVDQEMQDAAEEVGEAPSQYKGKGKARAVESSVTGGEDDEATTLPLDASEDTVDNEANSQDGEALQANKPSLIVKFRLPQPAALPPSAPAVAPASRTTTNPDERFDRAYVDAHPNENFHHRGRGIWAPGFPTGSAVHPRTAVLGPDKDRWRAEQVRKGWTS